MFSRPRIRQAFDHFKQLFQATWHAFVEDGGRPLSAALVYYLNLSVLPLLVLIASLPGLIVRFIDQQAGNRLNDSVAAIFGDPISSIISDYFERMQNQSLMVATISLVLLLFSSTSSFRFLRYAFRRIWADAEGEAIKPLGARLRKTVTQRSIDVAIAFGLILLIPVLAVLWLILLILTIFARSLIDDVPIIGDLMTAILQPLIQLIGFSLLTILLLKVLPPIHLRWRAVWLPGLISALGLLLCTYGLGIYIRFFSPLSIYGALGTIFAIQIWAYANGMVIFFCAELCKQLVQRSLTEESRTQG